MTDRDPVPDELAELFAAERAAPAGDAEMRAKIRARLAGVVGLLPAKAAAAAGTATVLGGTGKILAIVAISVGAGITATTVATSSEPSYAAAPAIHLVPEEEMPAPTPQRAASDEARPLLPAPNRPPVSATAAVKATAKAATTATSTAGAIPVAPASGPSEVKLLKRAWVALSSGNAGQALQLTREAERLYPDGALVEEREALRIQALAMLGLRSDARTAARQFIEKFPRSVHRTRVENAVRVEVAP